MQASLQLNLAEKTSICDIPNAHNSIDAHPRQPLAVVREVQSPDGLQLSAAGKSVELFARLGIPDFDLAGMIERPFNRAGLDRRCDSFSVGRDGEAANEIAVRA